MASICLGLNVLKDLWYQDYIILSSILLHYLVQGSNPDELSAGNTISMAKISDTETNKSPLYHRSIEYNHI